MGEDSDKLPQADSIDTSDLEKAETVNVNSNHVAHQPSRKVELDTGEEHVRFRRHWWQLWYVTASPSIQRWL